MPATVRVHRPDRADADNRRGRVVGDGPRRHEPERGQDGERQHDRPPHTRDLRLPPKVSLATVMRVVEVGQWQSAPSPTGAWTPPIE